MNEIATMELLRQRLRTRLGFLGVTVSDLARFMGITRQAIQGRLNGRDLRIGQVEELVEAIGTSGRYLLDPTESALREVSGPPPAWVVELKQEPNTIEACP